MRATVIAALFTAVAVVACSTSPLGRKQLTLLPEGQLAEMGAAAFQQVKAEKQAVEAPAVVGYVRCITDHITAQLDNGPKDWDVQVFRDDEPNAFALPGGKVGVFTGILDVAKNQSQLATVIAHEIAHVVADHPNERVSTTYATQAGLDLVQAIVTGGEDGQNLAGLLGLGAQVGVILPFTRQQESEADLYGLDLMARAGFDPRESVDFWQNMQQASEGGAPPEFLSTHPSGETRVRDLRGRMDRATRLFNQARAAGRTPDCRRP